MKDWTEHDYPERFDDLPCERQEALLEWIDLNLIPIRSFNDRHTSYGLKHLIRFEDGADAYFTNGEFKGAMLKAGYKVQNPSALNWVFNISQRSPVFTRR